ncbi:unnamed protein product [Auanema sp. JU1783]|nr:unnamed protein product [Auanema sp. JU1783]
MTKWKKALYFRQPYADNYSGGDEQFLKELKKNVSVVSYTYKEAVIGSANFMFHISSVALFYALYENVQEHNFFDVTIVNSFICLFVTLYIIFIVFLTQTKVDFVDHAYTVFTLFSFGYALTPIIRTLTDTISTDTIYAFSFLSALISCIFHDYGLNAPIVSFPLSLSSGLCSAIFLLSRMKENSPAFMMLSIAFVLHACSSTFRNSLFVKFPHVGFLISISLGVSVTKLVYDLSYPELSIIFFLLYVFVLLICPLILVQKQKQKRNIHGPWDEAVPTR